MVSAASLTVTLSTRLHTIADTMANSSAKPGLTPDPNIVEPPFSQASTIRSRPSPRLCPGDERRRGHHVDARRQNADQLVDVDPHRVVDNAIRLQREQGVDVVGGGDPQRRDADQLAGVAAGFLRRPGVAPHQFEQGVVGDRFEGALADVSGVPLNDSISVWHSLSIGKRCRARNGIEPSAFGRFRGGAVEHQLDQLLGEVVIDGFTGEQQAAVNWRDQHL